MWSLFLLSLLPLILYVVVDFYADLKWGVICAVGSSLIMAGVYWYLFGEIEYEMVGIVAILMLTGLFSIKKDNSIFIKFQPVVTNLMLVLVLLWFQIFDQSLFLKYVPKMAKIMRPEQVAMLSTPEMLGFLERMSIYSIIWILLHTAAVAFAAARLQNRYWLMAKALGGPFVVIGSLCTEVVVRLFI